MAPQKLASLPSPHTTVPYDDTYDHESPAVIGHYRLTAFVHTQFAFNELENRVPGLETPCVLRKK